MRQIIPSIILGAVALLLLWLSNYVMSGYSDCSVLHGLEPRPEDCAERVRMLGQELLRYAAAALAILAVTFPAITHYQKQRIADESGGSILK